MSKFNVTVKQTVYYRTEVEADTQEEAEHKVQALIDNDDLDDVWEFDNTDFKIC
tara:strand:+ start:528 stop:689 length:162 start_codon:yes stop_codon:yes gene_type:complete